MNTSRITFCRIWCIQDWINCLVGRSLMMMTHAKNKKMEIKKTTISLNEFFGDEISLNESGPIPRWELAHRPLRHTQLGAKYVNRARRGILNPKFSQQILIIATTISSCLLGYHRCLHCLAPLNGTVDVPVVAILSAWTSATSCIMAHATTGLLDTRVGHLSSS
jgi:hypothetical protein